MYPINICEELNTNRTTPNLLLDKQTKFMMGNFLLGMMKLLKLFVGYSQSILTGVVAIVLPDDY